MIRHLIVVLSAALLVSAAAAAESVSPAEVLASGLAAAAKRGFPRTEPEKPGPFAPTEAERSRGFAFFTRNVNLRLYPESVPAADERQEALYAFGAQGETVSAQAAVRALAALRGVTVRVSDLKGPEAAVVPAAGIRTRWVEYAPIRVSMGRRRRGEAPSGREPDRAAVVPLRLRAIPAGGLDLPAEWTQGVWFTVSVPADAPAGRYEGRIEVLAEGRPAGRFPVVLTVLPVRLTDLRSMFHGAFLMVHGAPDGPGVHTTAQLKDLADRGIHGLLWFWGHYGLKVLRDGDQLKLDFTLLDTYMERVKAAGIRGPVVLALGNDSRGHLEHAIADLWDLPLRRHTDRPQSVDEGETRPFAVGVLDSPRLDELYIEAVRQLLDHAREKRWPEIVLLPYDEPTERLKAEYIHRATLLKKHFPSVRIYAVVMGDVEELPWLAPPADILVTNGAPGAVAAYAREHGKDFWTYGGAVQASSTFGRARADYGLGPWALASQGHWFWAYNWHVGNWMDEFDGPRGDSGWVVAYPPERPGEPCVPSPAFEGMRAGIDDLRYVQALTDLLDRMPAAAAKPYRDRIEALRREARPERGRPTTRRAETRPADAPPTPPTPPATRPAPDLRLPFPTGPVSASDAFRFAVIRMILEVQGPEAGKTPG